uniref:Uncharacterized protein n=1 Tax=Arundo donax TaxID=35708 RepID=A0A0A9HQY2_ARUDO
MNGSNLSNCVANNRFHFSILLQSNHPMFISAIFVNISTRKTGRLLNSEQIFF